MKAAEERNITEIKRLMSLPVTQFRLSWISRKTVEKALLFDSLKQKATVTFGSLGISADEKQVSALIDSKLTAIDDFSKVNKEALIHEIVEPWKQMKLKDSLKQKATEKFETLGISADEKQVSALIDSKLTAIDDFSKVNEEAVTNEIVAFLKDHFNGSTGKATLPEDSLASSIQPMISIAFASLSIFILLF